MKIDKHELIKFKQKLQELALIKFGTHVDNLTPKVQIKLIDRTRTHADHFEPLPYSFFDTIKNGYQDLVDNPELTEQLDRLLRIAQANLSIATYDLETIIKLMSLTLKKEK